MRAVLALWVEGTLPGLNGCQDTVTLALAQSLRGPRNPHTLRRRQRELLDDDADRIDSWGPGQELEVEGCFAPLLGCTARVIEAVGDYMSAWHRRSQTFVSLTGDKAQAMVGTGDRHIQLSPCRLRTGLRCEELPHAMATAYNLPVPAGLVHTRCVPAAYPLRTRCVPATYPRNKSRRWRC